MKASSPRLSARHRRPRRPLAWRCLALVGLALVGVWQTPQRINADCALYLQQAELLFDGAVPYRDFVDTNPPLIAYLNVLPVALARTLGVSPIAAFGGLRRCLAADFGVGDPLPAKAVAAGSSGGWPRPGAAGVDRLVLRGGLARRHRSAGTPVRLALRAVSVLADPAASGGSVAVWFAILLGVQAGIGVALKPYFLFLAVNVEIVLLFATRRRRTLLKPENFALWGVVAAYLVHWLFVPAAMREAFFGRWLPLLSYGYGVYSVSYREVAKTIFGSPISLLGWRLPWRLHCSSREAARGCAIISWRWRHWPTWRWC